MRAAEIRERAGGAGQSDRRALIKLSALLTHRRRLIYIYNYNNCPNAPAIYTQTSPFLVGQICLPVLLLLPLLLLAGPRPTCSSLSANGVPVNAQTSLHTSGPTFGRAGGQQASGVGATWAPLAQFKTAFDESAARNLGRVRQLARDRKRARSAGSARSSARAHQAQWPSGWPRGLSGAML